MYCGHCGGEISPGVAFCSHCGEAPGRQGSGVAAPARAEGERPTGVTLLALLGFTGAVLLAFAGFAMLAGSALLGVAFGSMVGQGEAGGALGAAIGVFVTGFLFGLAILVGVASWGLWAGQVWGWGLALAIQGLSAFFDLLGLIEGEFPDVIGLLVAGLIIWYLLQPHVKAYFRVGG